MRFDKLFEGRSWLETPGRLGVMSVDSLNRGWKFVAAEGGYLIAIANDGKDALLGRMCKRDDGKYCIELVVRAGVDNDRFHRYESWYVDMADRDRFAQWLEEAVRKHLGNPGSAGNGRSWIR